LKKKEWLKQEKNVGFMFLNSVIKFIFTILDQRLRNAGELEDDLANSDTRGSINSAVIQVFWKHVLTSYLHSDPEVRIAVSQVVYQTMMQGLVTPGDPLPTMIAMTTDLIPSIRNKIEPLLKEIDQKYGGMLVTKAIAGIRWTFEIHRKLYIKSSHVFRGFRASEHCTENVLDSNGLPKTSSEAVSVLNALYACLRTNRQQRRSFLKNVIQMFSDDSREKPQLEEMIFIADNLATFPYQVSDEPLYIIHTADQIISLTGQNFLTNIKTLLQPKRVGELVDEEDEFTTENIYKRLPDDKGPIYALMKSSQACFLLLHIKTYLIKLYKLTEAKVKEYNPAESAKITDKPITRQQIPVFSPDNALQELRPEVISQRETFDGQINLCEQIGFFRNMFYSLDIHADLDDEEKLESADETINEPSAKRRRVISDEDDG
jgi:cohesin loading factor subunit SCC2